MRENADLTRIRLFMRALGERARQPARVYLTGGATAVLHGWRSATLDIDLKLSPERDELLRALPELKERLRLNVELAAPLDFIPVRRDWEERSPFIAQEGRLSFHHFDLCAQALANPAAFRMRVERVLARGSERPPARRLRPASAGEPGRGARRPLPTATAPALPAWRRQ